jgi:hypothetical protein
MRLILLLLSLLFCCGRYDFRPCNKTTHNFLKINYFLMFHSVKLNHEASRPKLQYLTWDVSTNELWGGCERSPRDSYI